jgi:Zn-dependent metalloprotease
VVRLRCVCCALPARVLEHVAAKTGTSNADHHETSQRIRAERNNATPDKATDGKRERFIHDAAHKEQLPGRIVRAEGAAKVRDAAVNEAYENIGITLDFFSNVFNRDSLDAAGMDVIASVHYGRNFSNAMWNGAQMLFGDGDGVGIRGFTQSLDIVAHELTHAVTQYAIPGGLGVVRKQGKPDLAGEAGALNESISDVFASLVKQWHRRQDAKKADWLLGEGILAPALGHAVRSLKEPGNPARTYEADHQVAHMSRYVAGGDVHANSGIPNHAFYLAATAIGGHAWEHAGRIWYDAVGKLRPKSTFADAAHATADAAARLFGTASAEQQAVRAAWQKVGVSPG